MMMMMILDRQKNDVLDSIFVQSLFIVDAVRNLHVL